MGYVGILLNMYPKPHAIYSRGPNVLAAGCGISLIWWDEGLVQTGGQLRGEAPKFIRRSHYSFRNCFSLHISPETLRSF